eukprot:3572303-Rhodomonas_salina.1
MTLEAWVGPERNILSQSAEHVNRLYLEHPVLTNQLLPLDHAAAISAIPRCVSFCCISRVLEARRGV